MTKKKRIDRTIQDFHEGALAYTADEVGLLVGEIERFRKLLRQASDDLTLVVAKTRIGKDRTVIRMAKYIHAEKRS